MWNNKVVALIIIALERLSWEIVDMLSSMQAVFDQIHIVQDPRRERERETESKWKEPKYMLSDCSLHVKLALNAMHQLWSCVRIRLVTSCQDSMPAALLQNLDEP